MKKTGFLYDERYLRHDTGPNHPESPERLKAIYQGIKNADLLPKLTLIQAQSIQKIILNVLKLPVIQATPRLTIRTIRFAPKLLRPPFWPWEAYWMRYDLS